MANTYLSKTFGQAGNRKTWTWSAWVKLFKGDAQLLLFSEQTNSYPSGGIYLQGNQELRLSFATASNNWQIAVDTDAKYRDVSGWYHYVVAVDTTQSTASDRVKIYVNGVLQTLLNGLASNGGGSSDPLYPSQNYDCLINRANLTYIGGDNNYSSDCAMTHVHFTDGNAYPASTFGESDSNGVWKPKTSPSVTYGTNGFFLKMDNSGNMGLDSSGNSNNWTTSGTITQAKDTPSNVFCTWNPFTNENASATFSNGNNTVFFNNSNEKHILATLGMNSGKFYWESKLVSHSADSLAKVGIESSLHNNAGGYAVDSYGYRGEGGGSGDASSGRKVNNGTFTNWGSSYTAGDIIGCAVDLDNNKIYFSKNGTWQESGDPTSGSTGTGSAFNLIAPVSGFYHPSIGKEASATATWSMNFGNGYFGTTAVTSAGTNASGIGIFEYDVPTGYTALSTKGLNS